MLPMTMHVAVSRVMVLRISGLGVSGLYDNQIHHRYGDETRPMWRLGLGAICSCALDVLLTRDHPLMTREHVQCPHILHPAPRPINNHTWNTNWIIAS